MSGDTGRCQKLSRFSAPRIIDPSSPRHKTPTYTSGHDGRIGSERTYPFLNHHTGHGRRFNLTQKSRGPSDRSTLKYKKLRGTSFEKERRTLETRDGGPRPHPTPLSVRIFRQSVLSEEVCERRLKPRTVKTWVSSSYPESGA